MIYFSVFKNLKKKFKNIPWLAKLFLYLTVSCKVHYIFISFASRTLKWKKRQKLCMLTWFRGHWGATCLLCRWQHKRNGAQDFKSTIARESERQVTPNIHSLLSLELSKQLPPTVIWTNVRSFFCLRTILGSRGFLKCVIQSYVSE